MIGEGAACDPARLPQARQSMHPESSMAAVCILDLDLERLKSAESLLLHHSRAAGSRYLRSGTTLA